MPQLLRCLAAAVFLAYAPSSSVAEGVAHIAVLMDIKGAIGPATTEYVRDGFREARERSARLVILRLDTPGGLDSAMREIIQEILASRIPVAAYVSPSGARAASAGTYILYASHLAAMAPSTHLGAATPVQIGIGLRPGDQGETGKAPVNAAEAKAINDAAAYIRGLAELRGRNADWAEKAVREAATLTATEAQSYRVIEIVAGDLPDLLRQANGRTANIAGLEVTIETDGLTITPLEANWRARVLAVITDPNVAYLLMLMGFYGLLLEFIAPGGAVPGVVGGIAILVALYALNLLPINYAGVALILLGIALMIAEAFLPSFGVVGLGGIVSFAAGSLFLFRAAPGFQISWPVVVTATAASLGFFAFALGAVWRAHRRKVVTGESALVGSTGQVLTWSAGKGEIQVLGERWRAISAAELGPGQLVRVLGRRDLTLDVGPASEFPERS